MIKQKKTVEIDDGTIFQEGGIFAPLVKAGKGVVDGASWVVNNLHYPLVRETGKTILRVADKHPLAPVFKEAGKTAVKIIRSQPTDGVADVYNVGFPVTQSQKPIVLYGKNFEERRGINAEGGTAMNAVSGVSKSDNDYGLSAVDRYDMFKRGEQYLDSQEQYLRSTQNSHNIVKYAQPIVKSGIEGLKSASDKFTETAQNVGNKIKDTFNQADEKLQAKRLNDTLTKAKDNTVKLAQNAAEIGQRAYEDAKTKLTDAFKNFTKSKTDQPADQQPTDQQPTDQPADQSTDQSTTQPTDQQTTNTNGSKSADVEGLGKFFAEHGTQVTVGALVVAGLLGTYYLYRKYKKNKKTTIQDRENAQKLDRIAERLK